jgi:hypothetical protein
VLDETGVSRNWSIPSAAMNSARSSDIWRFPWCSFRTRTVAHASIRKLSRRRGGRPHRVAVGASAHTALHRFRGDLKLNGLCRSSSTRTASLCSRRAVRLSWRRPAASPSLDPAQTRCRHAAPRSARLEEIESTSTAAERKTKQRAVARARGLCGECCIGKPRKGLLNCDECLEDAAERVRRNREAAAS